jgi:hypothetical protein
LFLLAWLMTVHAPGLADDGGADTPTGLSLLLLVLRANLLYGCPPGSEMLM